LWRGGVERGELQEVRGRRQKLVGWAPRFDGYFLLKPRGECKKEMSKEG
jgi:hypothetical protein